MAVRVDPPLDGTAERVGGERRRRAGAARQGQQIRPQEDVQLVRESEEGAADAGGLPAEPVGRSGAETDEMSAFLSSLDHHEE